MGPTLVATPCTRLLLVFMRKLLYLFFSMALVAVLTTYAMWAADRPAGHYLSDLRIKLAVDEGTPADRGNLLGIQPELFPTDYQSPERLHRKLAAYLQQAQDQGLLNDKTVVVLPENVGTWLMLSGEKDELYQAPTLAEAMNWLAASNPLLFARAWLSANGNDRLNDAHLRMKSKAMAKDYQALFGGLAKEFHVTLVAGSIVLPEPSIRDGQLKPGNGALFNSSVVFGRDGVPLGQPQRQMHPVFDQRDVIEGDAAHIINVSRHPGRTPRCVDRQRQLVPGQLPQTRRARRATGRRARTSLWPRRLEPAVARLQGVEHAGLGQSQAR